MNPERAAYEGVARAASGSPKFSSLQPLKNWQIWPRKSIFQPPRQRVDSTQKTLLKGTLGLDECHGAPSDCEAPKDWTITSENQASPSTAQSENAEAVGSG